MEQFNERLAWLFKQYQQGLCTSAEKMEFFDLLEKEENNPQLIDLMKRAVEESGADRSMDPGKADQIFNTIVGLQPTGEAKNRESVITMAVWKKLAVAASLLILTGLGILKLISFSAKDKLRPSPVSRAENIIKPGTDNAILTLSDGSTIVLDKTADGALAYQGKVAINKYKGQISYKGNQPAGGQLFNTIRTARGNQYEVVLSDGTRVWLNASSSIYFPTSFKPDERWVRITGEAYFEVAHNARAPFKVEVNGAEIKVLGTHFNVNAYDESAAVKTTLLEGSVKLTRGNSEQLLKPGQEGIVQPDGKIDVNRNADVDEIMAWRNGIFFFNRKDIKTIMQQISQWYDVDIEYSGPVTKETFSGVASRQSDVRQVLRIMEDNGVKFTIEGKKIIVQ